MSFQTTIFSHFKAVSDLDSMKSEPYIDGPSHSQTYSQSGQSPQSGNSKNKESPSHSPNYSHSPTNSTPDTQSPPDSPSRKTEPQFHFSPEQEAAYNKYVEGRNVFITGPGGTGKSALIKHIYHHALQYKRKIQVCALTGCAAVLLGCKATTIHSWSGIGLANSPPEDIIKRISKNFFRSKMWRTVQVLVIDEVSMMSKHIFDLLNVVAKAIRNNHRPFGGIQVIFSGDFYQLPPVGYDNQPETKSYCFESEYWAGTFRPQDHIQLFTIFRQKDPVYCSILNQIREGRIKKSTDTILKSRIGANFTEHAEKQGASSYATKPTRLFPLRHKAEAINVAEMTALGDAADTEQYDMIYTTSLPTTEKNKKYLETVSQERIGMEFQSLKNGIMCDEKITLKVGCQVMCIVNMLEDNDVGSSVGLVICNGSQGIVSGFVGSNPRLPVVRFDNGCVRTMSPHTWESENIPGVGIQQIPLILSWAITIHKSQGASIDRCIVDVGSGVFECGQTYVALSRVKSLEGLSLVSYDFTKICVSKKVQDFYEKLKKA